jgi:hypothetical protein
MPTFAAQESMALDLPVDFRKHLDVTVILRAGNNVARIPCIGTDLAGVDKNCKGSNPDYSSGFVAAMILAA